MSSLAALKQSQLRTATSITAWSTRSRTGAKCASQQKKPEIRDCDSAPASSWLSIGFESASSTLMLEKAETISFVIALATREVLWRCELWRVYLAVDGHFSDQERAERANHVPVPVEIFR